MSPRASAVLTIPVPLAWWCLQWDAVATEVRAADGAPFAELAYFLPIGEGALLGPLLVLQVILLGFLRSPRARTISATSFGFVFLAAAAGSLALAHVCLGETGRTLMGVSALVAAIASVPLFALAGCAGDVTVER